MSLFLSEEESNSRLNDSRNVLSRINRDTLTSDDVTIPAAGDVIIPTVSIPSSTDVPVEADAEPTLVETDSDESKEDIDPTILLKLDKIMFGAGEKVGRKRGIRNRSLEENASIATMSIALGNSATEQMTAVSAPQQHYLKDGYTGSVPHAEKKAPKDELLDEIYTQGREVTNRSFRKLLSALDLIDGPQHRLSKIADVTKLVTVAGSLSRIIKDMTPKESGPMEGNVHFHIMVPERNPESAYETLEVNRDGTVTVGI